MHYAGCDVLCWSCHRCELSDTHGIVVHNVDVPQAEQEVDVHSVTRTRGNVIVDIRSTERFHVQSIYFCTLSLNTSFLPPMFWQQHLNRPTVKAARARNQAPRDAPGRRGLGMLSQNIT